MNSQQRAIIILVFIGIIYLTYNEEITEGFNTYYGYYKKYCPSCGWRSRYSCSNCTNCGYCITADGRGECVPGDKYGPYFRDDCQFYEYGKPSEYSPYSMAYPVVQVRTRYPYDI